MTIVLLSGGLDSSTLLATALETDEKVDTLSVDYGQRHRRELGAAAALARHYGVRNDVVDLTAIRPLIAGGSLSDPQHHEVPDGHYTEATMRTTVSPNRNAIMIAVAAGVAAARRHRSVLVAVHGGDHYIYPDCRPDFIDAMDRATQLATRDPFRPVHVGAPFLDWTKADIARQAAQLRVPVELTWSCYKGGTNHCGRCGTCVERQEAFALAGVEDPTTYDDPDYWRGAVERVK